MKKFSILVFVTLSLALLIPINVFAHSPSIIDNQRTNELKDLALQLENELVVSLGELGSLDEILYSPYDSMRISFNIPPEWQFTIGSKFVLDYEVLLGGSDIGKVPGSLGNFVGVLSIVFNNQVIDEVYVDSVGKQNLEISIPAAALVSARSNGRHELSIIFNGSLSCEYDIRTTIVVKSSSFFVLPYTSSPPPLDLSRLPYPFYVRGNVRPTTSLFVVPNNPEPGELQAALNVLGGLGSLTGSDFIFEMVTANQLTEELITNSNIIFIGKPENLEILSSIQFPMLVENGQFDSPSIDLIDEGVIQLAASPWNPNKSVLLVSGKTTDSVNKAANAISTGRLFITGPSDLAFIADVQTEIDKYSIVERFRLKDLGYSTVTLSNGLGFTSSSNETSYSFFLPKEQIASEGGSIELVYYTGRVVINESSISVSLNDKKIAAIILDESTSGSLKTYKIDIPPGLLRFGENQLDIVVDLIPIYSCDTLGLPDYFIAVHENTLINIPVALDKTGEDLPLDFRMYPGHFIDSTDLSNVAFILSQGDPLGWNVASKIAFDLGRLGDPLLSNMAVAYSDAVSEEIRQGNDLIVVGRASKSPFLAEMNDHLPAPFNLETDAANEKGLQVTYITPPGVNLGYLELLNSPFNQDNEVLVISGNTDDGMILAGRAITETGLRRELMGLFAITNGSQIATSRVLTPFGFNENQGSITATLVPSAVPYVTTPIPTIPGGTTPSMTQPNWLTPILIASLVIILIIIVRQVVISRK